MRGEIFLGGAKVSSPKKKDKKESGVPKYAEPGSQGPVFNAILFALMVWASKNLSYSEFATLKRNVCFDAKFGNVLKRLAEAYQAKRGLGIDGGIGPETRGELRSNFGFDFDAAVISSGGVSSFVQPDGKKIIFPPLPEAEEAEALDIADVPFDALIEDLTLP